MEDSTSEAADWLPLHDRWQSGERDRELALHLFFLSWHMVVEPAFLTGMDAAIPEFELVPLTVATAAWLLPHDADTDDVEALYVVGLAANMFGFYFGDEKVWTAKAQSYRVRYRDLAPHGLDPKLFEGRGKYGRYYAQMAQVVGGY